MFESLLSSLSSLRPFAWRTALALFLMTSVVLFLPDAFLQVIALDTILISSKTTIGLAWLLSLSILAVEVFDAIMLVLIRHKSRWEIKRNMTLFLQSVSGDEKAILREFLNRDVSTIHFALSGGIANALEAKGILTRTSHIGLPGVGDSFPFSIQPLAVEILKKKPNLLD